MEALRQILPDAQDETMTLDLPSLSGANSVYPMLSNTSGVFGVSSTQETLDFLQGLEIDFHREPSVTQEEFDFDFVGLPLEASHKHSDDGEGQCTPSSLLLTLEDGRQILLHRTVIIVTAERESRDAGTAVLGNKG